MNTSQNTRNGWIGVDLDGTLAQYDGWKGPLHIGEPVPKMLARVKQWLNEGRDVRIFTARVNPDSLERAFLETGVRGVDQMAAIQQWLEKHLGTGLKITCTKDMQMIELWDDRAVAVMPNTGEAVRYTDQGSVFL